MAQSIQQYRIDVLLTLARITTDESKKAGYIEEIEALLSDLESCVNRPNFPDQCSASVFFETDNYIQEADNASIVGRTLKAVYDDYIKYCNENGIAPLSKNSFGSRMKRSGWKNQTSRIRDEQGNITAEVQRCYTYKIPSENN